MARPRFIPTKEQLKTFYSSRRKGEKVKDIIAKMGISRSQFQRAKSFFDEYFAECDSARRLQIAKKTYPSEALRKEPRRKGPRPKPTPFVRGPKMLREDDFDYDTIRAYSVLNYSHETIAGLLRMSPRSLYHYRKRYPILDYTIRYGREEISAQMIKNIKTQASDRMVKDTAVASFQGSISTKTIERHAPGNAQLVKLWMVNKEKWSTEPRPEAKDNKGLILKMLNTMTGDDAEAGDDKVEDYSQGPPALNYEDDDL